jgi:sugar phosphate isomerase/epimerase
LQIRDGAFHLTYCTNIHAADGWDAVFANVKRYATALKATFSPSERFGIGLRLSAREARELLERDMIAFRSFLEDEGLYVAVINGFPYGHFHGAPVKASVYAPDWRDEARVQYTLDLIRILHALLPVMVEGGVSTAPLSYKPWMSDGGPSAWSTITNNIVRIAEALVRLRRHSGAFIHLDIEPEPDCLLENAAESVAFFEQHLFPVGAPALAAALGVSADEAGKLLRDHVRLCFDCCHFAVEYEDPAAALARIHESGIKIGRIQLSSALVVRFPDDPAGVATLTERLERFADTTYLHQVVERRGDELRHYADLDDALRSGRASSPSEWRIHFHVPLFASEYEGLESTQSYVARVLGLAAEGEFTRHLEIETYTWDVLPDGLKVALPDSIAREYRWVLDTLDRIPLRAR